MKDGAGGRGLETVREGEREKGLWSRKLWDSYD